MATEDKGLERLKQQMNGEQQRRMAEMIAAEVKRRQGSGSAVKSAAHSKVQSSGLGSQLGHEHLNDIYAEMNQKIRRDGSESPAGSGHRAGAMRANVRRAATMGGKVSRGSLLRLLFVGGVGTLALLKIFVASGGVETSAKPASQLVPAGSQYAAMSEVTLPAPAGRPGADARAALDRRLVGWSPAEKQLLTELDARRVELEKRKQALDERETQLNLQAQALNERLAELKTLTGRIGQVRKERDHQYESRLEQLASVYGSMAPNEAAPLISKLDEETAIALLKRMPGKRMGQILSLMDQDRALQLTRILSDKKRVGEASGE